MSLLFNIIRSVSSADTAGPYVSSATINLDGDTLTLVINEAVNMAFVPVVSVAGTDSIAGTAAWANATTLEVPLSPVAFAGEVVTYSIAAGQFQDVAGNVNTAIIAAATTNNSDVASYNIASAFHDSKRALVSGQEITPSAVEFSPDGLSMFVVGTTNDTVYQYTLTTAWEVTTASYASLSFSVTTQESNPTGMAFSADGTSMYIVGLTNAVVYQYTLSTPWVINTASYASLSFSIIGQDSAPAGIKFAPDGTKMFMLGSSNDQVNQYTLSTPWNVSTAVYASVNFSIAAQEATSTDLAFSSDGLKMYLVGSSQDRVYQYTLVTPWSLVGMSYSGLSFLVSGQETTPTGLTFSSDGSKMFVLGSTQDAVYQYNLGTAWAVDTSVFGPMWVAVTTGPFGLDFSSDGTKMYVLDVSLTIVTQYTLSTPWVVRSAVASGLTYNFNATAVTGTGVTFSADGSAMFIVANTADTVYQYTLSTPWNVSTASYASLSLSTGGQDISPNDIAFSTDGTKLYVVGINLDRVYQYTLPTPWSLSGASYSTLSASVGTQDGAPQGVAFSNDGTKMFIVGASTDRVYQYSLSTPWVINTASYASIFVSVLAQDSAAESLRFSPGGSRMYVVGATNNRVNQYDLAV